MPVAVKQDATKLSSRSRTAKTDKTRAVPAADSVVAERMAEQAFFGEPDAQQAAEQTAGQVTEEATQTNVQVPLPSTPASPAATVTPLAGAYQMAPLNRAGYLGSREDIQNELDAIAFAVRAFPLKQPDQILRECSAYSARLTERTVLLHRSEDYDRQYTRVRTMQVQKWVEELERQWKTASRLIEVQRQDIALMS